MSSKPTDDRRKKPGKSGARAAVSALDHIPAVSVEELLSTLSLALDLAEGRPKGHALRVSFISAAIAGALDLGKAQRTAVLFAGLLHDIGVPQASGSLGAVGRGHEHELFAGSPLLSPEVLAARAGADASNLVEVFHEHAFAGATAAASLGLPPMVAEGILCHHERHDGSGFPLRLSGNEISPVARVVGIADYAESLLSATTNPLLARRSLETALREIAGRGFHPQVVEALAAVTRRDDFWLGFHNRELAALLAGFAEDDRHAMKDAAVLRTTAAVADIVEARNSFKRGHSRRVAVQARGLAAAMGLPEGHARAVELAGLLHDIGMLRVPNRIIGKPEILTVEEMHLLRQHPAESADIVRSIPAWAPLAAWTAAHHERLDGRGYPEGLEAEEIPLEARILAIADVYEALTAHRPHRPALPREEALRTMRGMTGTYLDPAVFATFERVLADAPQTMAANE